MPKMIDLNKKQYELILQSECACMDHVFDIKAFAKKYTKFANIQEKIFDETLLYCHKKTMALVYNSFYGEDKDDELISQYNIKTQDKLNEIKTNLLIDIIHNDAETGYVVVCQYFDVLMTYFDSLIKEMQNSNKQFIIKKIPELKEAIELIKQHHVEYKNYSEN
jgi:hypothetical protein